MTTATFTSSLALSSSFSTTAPRTPGHYKQKGGVNTKCYVLSLRHISIKLNIENVPVLALPSIDEDAKANANQWRSFYRPSPFPRPLSDKFKAFRKDFIVQKLREVDERQMHFAGWMYFHGENIMILDWMQNWMCTISI